MEDSPEARRGIAARIARSRLAAGFENASEFARQVGVSPNTVYRWERAEVVPSIFQLESIGRVARVTTDWILRGGSEEGAGTPQALLDWRQTPRGQTASAAAMRFLESLPLEGYRPSPGFYDLALLAYEQGLSPADAALAARFTEGKVTK